MLSVVENMMSNRPEEQMHSVKEDETSSGFLSAESNLDTFLIVGVQLGVVT